MKTDHLINARYYWVRPKPVYEETGKSHYPMWQPMLWCGNSFWLNAEAKLGDGKAVSPEDIEEVGSLIDGPATATDHTSGWLAVVASRESRPKITVNHAHVFPSEQSARRAGNLSPLPVKVVWCVEDMHRIKGEVKSTVS